MVTEKNLHVGELSVRYPVLMIHLLGTYTVQHKLTWLQTRTPYKLLPQCFRLRLLLSASLYFPPFPVPHSRRREWRVWRTIMCWNTPSPVTPILLYRCEADVWGMWRRVRERREKSGETNPLHPPHTLEKNGRKRVSKGKGYEMLSCFRVANVTKNVTTFDLSERFTGTKKTGSALIKWTNVCQIKKSKITFKPLKPLEDTWLVSGEETNLTTSSSATLEGFLFLQQDTEVILSCAWLLQAKLWLIASTGGL